MNVKKIVIERIEGPNSEVGIVEVFQVGHAEMIIEDMAKTAPKHSMLQDKMEVTIEWSDGRKYVTKVHLNYKMHKEGFNLLQQVEERVLGMASDKVSQHVRSTPKDVQDFVDKYIS